VGADRRGGWGIVDARDDRNEYPTVSEGAARTSKIDGHKATCPTGLSGRRWQVWKDEQRTLSHGLDVRTALCLTWLSIFHSRRLCVSRTPPELRGRNEESDDHA
jgi:hypothetical protein